MREMLNRALVLDTLADMGAITPRSTTELHANWRECFSIKNPRAKAPRDDDPEAGQLYMQFLEPAGEKAEEDSLQLTVESPSRSRSSSSNSSSTLCGSTGSDVEEKWHLRGRPPPSDTEERKEPVHKEHSKKVSTLSKVAQAVKSGRASVRKSAACDELFGAKDGSEFSANKMGAVWDGGSCYNGNCYNGEDYGDLQSETESVADAAPVLKVHTLVAELSALSEAKKERLRRHIRTLDQSKQAAGFPATMDIDYAVDAVDSLRNTFFLARWIEGPLGGRCYVGFVIGNMRVVHEEEVLVDIDCVIAQQGHGMPLMKSLLFAELEPLQASFGDRAVHFKLSSVRGSVRFYQKLGFHNQRQVGAHSLQPMRLPPVRFQLTLSGMVKRIFCAPSDANGDEAATKETGSANWNGYAASASSAATASSASAMRDGQTLASLARFM